MLALALSAVSTLTTTALTGSRHSPGISRVEWGCKTSLIGASEGCLVAIVCLGTSPFRTGPLWTG